MLQKRIYLKLGDKIHLKRFSEMESTINFAYKWVCFRFWTKLKKTTIFHRPSTLSEGVCQFFQINKWGECNRRRGGGGGEEESGVVEEMGTVFSWVSSLPENGLPPFLNLRMNIPLLNMKPIKFSQKNHFWQFLKSCRNTGNSLCILLIQVQCRNMLYTLINFRLIIHDIRHNINNVIL